MSEKLKNKELAILREAVDKAEKKAGKQLVKSQDVQNIIDIVENYIRKKKLVCYGGTAINNMLPITEQFYDKNIELPDYDFYSPNALDDAKELADIYAKEGYYEIEAKAGMHHGTFKVFINYIAVADITALPKQLFKTVQKDSIKIDGILYAPPDYLRMSMYLELSRPEGDVSRWEKVLKRLLLLNKSYPMKNPRCDNIDFMRSFEGSQERAEDLYDKVKDAIINQHLVFFGGYASKLYSKYMPQKLKHKFDHKNPDFDVLSNEPHKSAIRIKERLESEGYKKIKIIKQKGVGEIIAPHYEIAINNDTLAFIYKPLACHSYNVIRLKGKSVKVATIDTMLSFYLAFLFANRKYYDHDRIYCMAQYLFQVQAQNRLAQKGVLKRFSLNCIGNQETIEDIKNKKSKKFDELKFKKNCREYQEWFLKYDPWEESLYSEDISERKQAKQEEKTKKKNKKQRVKPNKKKTISKASKKKKIKLIGLNF